MATESKPDPIREFAKDLCSVAVLAAKRRQSWDRGHWSLEAEFATIKKDIETLSERAIRLTFKATKDLCREDDTADRCTEEQLEAELRELMAKEG